MSACLTRLIRSLALMTLIKNLGRHSLPSLRRISSWDLTTRLGRSLASRQRLQREKGTSTYTTWYREFRWNKRYKVHSFLPHRRSWGSGRWMCTWIANSIQIPPAIQKYIPTNIQRNDLNSSKNYVIGVGVARVLIPAYFRASSRWRQRRRRNSLLGEEGNRQER
jgi:hypothetical protein